MAAHPSPEVRADEYLSLRDCAAEVSVTSWVIWKACRQQIIPSIRVGSQPGTGHYRIRRADWEAYKRGRAVRPLPPILVASGDGSPLIDSVMERMRASRRPAKTEGRKGG